MTSHPDDAPAELQGFDADLVGADGYHDAGDAARRRPLALRQRVRRRLRRRRARRSRALAGVATVADETSSWPYRHDRDLTGFIDGSENPTLIDAPEFALDARRTARRRRHDPPTAEVEPRRNRLGVALGRQEQEQVIGRRKDDSVELDDKPADSHVAGTDQDRLREDLPPQHAVRTVTDHGTMFVGFSAEQRPLSAMLENMAGLVDGVRDALTQLHAARSPARTTSCRRRSLLRAAIDTAQ